MRRLLAWLREFARPGPGGLVAGKITCRRACRPNAAKGPLHERPDFP
jgi:hypothetical protein